MPFCEGVGGQIHYEVGGSGPPMLLLNGLVASAYLWPRSWLERFEATRTVVRVSNRGTGHTPLGEKLTVDAMAEDALAVLDALHLGPTPVLGFSMGGMVAQSLTLARPERVTALVLASTTTGGENDVHPEFLAAIGNSGGDTASAASSFFHLLTAPGFFERSPETLSDLGRGWQAAPTPPDTAIAQLVAAAGFDSRQRLTQIDVPVLVLHGLEDRLLVPAGGERLASGIGGARLELYPDVGHMLPFEVPQESGEVIEGFLSRALVGESSR
ncbi:MAG: alpha/beta hydrolase [Actinobacteria bacterium]|nr:alpha/beta hydrolase [Actinomycetota bacterium]